MVKGKLLIHRTQIGINSMVSLWSFLVTCDLLLVTSFGWMQVEFFEEKWKIIYKKMVGKKKMCIFAKNFCLL